MSESSQSPLSDIEGESRKVKKVIRFTVAQKAFMNAYYKQGMTGTGKQYRHLVERAAADSGLTRVQVEV